MKHSAVINEDSALISHVATFAGNVIQLMEPIDCDGLDIHVTENEGTITMTVGSKTILESIGEPLKFQYRSFSDLRTLSYQALSLSKVVSKKAGELIETETK